jgi:hypothetical protein
MEEGYAGRLDVEDTCRSAGVGLGKGGLAGSCRPQSTPPQPHSRPHPRPHRPRSFLELAKALAAAVCSEVMRDAGLAEQFGRLYAGQDWASGATTATVVATLKGEGCWLLGWR